MTNHRQKKYDKNCKEYKVPICQIEELVKLRQIKHMQDTGTYLSIPRAIIKLVKGE